MLHLQPSDRLFISEDQTGYSDEFIKMGIMSRRIDLMFLGFSYAINNNLHPAEDYRRRPLIQVALIDKDLMIAVEAITQWYAKELGYEEIGDESELLKWICSLGIAGMYKLQDRWKSMSKSQIQFDIAGLG